MVNLKLIFWLYSSIFDKGLQRLFTTLTLIEIKTAQVDPGNLKP